MPRAARARAPADAPAAADGVDLPARLHAAARATTEAAEAIGAALRTTTRGEGLRAAERLDALFESVSAPLVGVDTVSAASPDLERVLA